MATYTTEVNSLDIRNTTNQIVIGHQGSLSPTTTISCPVPGSSRTYTIPDAGSNTNFVMGAGNQSISGTTTFSGAPVFSNGAFFTASSNQWQIQPTGSGASYIVSGSTPGQATTLNLYDPGVGSTNIQLGSAKVAHITARTTLTTAQSGTTFFIDSAAAAVSINLPTITAGVRYKFIVTNSSLANAVTVVAPSANFKGVAIAADGSAVSSADPFSGTNVIFGTGSKISDVLNVECDGVNYYGQANISIHTSLTFS